MLYPIKNFASGPMKTAPTYIEAVLLNLTIANYMPVPALQFLQFFLWVTISATADRPTSA